MINEAIFYTATCDNCGKLWENGYNGIVALNEKSGMEQQLQDDEWHIEEGTGKCYCPNCFEIDDDDNLIVLEAKN